MSFDDVKLRKQTADALRVLGGGAPDAVVADGVAPESGQSIAELRQPLTQEADSALAADPRFTRMSDMTVWM